MWVLFAVAAAQEAAPPNWEPDLPRRKDLDGDGYRNDVDLCPTEPEALGGGDGDGCPDSTPLGGVGRVLSDSDGDGLPLSMDRCPDDPEDVDGFEDDDGCPDPDNDLDGVPDAMDQCVSEPGTQNGCPSSAPPPQLQRPAPQPAAVARAAPSPLPSIDGRLPSGVRSSADAAVVIGLEDYAFVPDVPYARRDAEAFATFLLYTRGVPQDRIRTLSAGSVEQIRAAVRDAGAQVGAGGTVWIYFAGHGAASIAKGERVLLGDDVRPDPVAFDARTLPVTEVESLASAGGGKALLVLDTCYAGAGRNGQTLLAGRRFAVPTYAVPPSGSAAQWLAVAPDELSGPLEEVQHGAFTYLALGALRGWADGELDGRADGAVTAEEAQAFVGRGLRTLQVHDQHPAWVGGAGASGWVLSTGATEAAPERFR
jgi:hypothetical protein